MNNIFVNISQLGYQPDSSKTVTLICNDNGLDLKDKIPFYVQRSGDRLKRKQKLPEGWKGRYFRWPFNIEDCEIDELIINEKSSEIKPIYKGILIKKESRWGNVWQADFSDFNEEGIYQIETQFQISLPFAIDKDIYKRILRSYLIFINAQRSGYDNPGIRKAQHLDDGILDTNRQQIDAAGGWYDAGDYRKQLPLTQGNLDILCQLSNYGISSFEEKAKDEIIWGNKYFHAMINEEGRVYEDIGGGIFKEGLDYEKEWWHENHPGCNSDNAGNVLTDNIPDSGDERIVRTKINPFGHFLFAYTEAKVAKLFQDEYGEKCKQLALKAWNFINKLGHDNRTLYLAAKIIAAIELYTLDNNLMELSELRIWMDQLLKRQNTDTHGISGFFTEKNNSDGFRSIIYTFPAMAILKSYILFKDDSFAETLKNSLLNYIDNYLLADATSNPFGVTPYGIYLNPENQELQTYRSAGNGKHIRTFMHPISEQEIIHGTNSVLMYHAALLVQVSKTLDEKRLIVPAEKLIQWSMGHNTDGVSFVNGIGYKHPVAYSSVHVQIPETAYVGYIGTREDVPYIETSNWIEWSTQEMWDVPFFGLVEAALILDKS